MRCATVTSKRAGHERCIDTSCTCRPRVHWQLAADGSDLLVGLDSKLHRYFTAVYCLAYHSESACAGAATPRGPGRPSIGYSMH
jgi:hypothetical protein